MNTTSALYKLQRRELHVKPLKSGSAKPLSRASRRVFGSREGEKAAARKSMEKQQLFNE